MGCDYTRPGAEPWWDAPHAKQESAKPSPESESTIHKLPGESGITPCCGELIFELPRTDRVTQDPENVTCNGPEKSFNIGDTDLSEYIEKAEG